MSARRVNGKTGVAVFSAALLAVISVGPVKAETVRPLPQYLIVQAAIDGVLAAAGGFPDCNENGVDDGQDIVSLTSPDCNGNGIPDECEINENSIAPGGPFFCADQCDPDCNRSSVPDECELTGNDCNADGRPDECGMFIACDSTEDQKLNAFDAAASDEFGRSVSIRGDTAVVGSHHADCAAGEDCGAVYVYRFDGTNWIVKQKLVALDAAANDEFGGSLSISGDVLVVGAFRDDCAAGSDCGAAYVYRFNGTNWIEQQKLTASDAAEFDRFGSSVSISDDTVVVGAYYADCTAGDNCGAAYVYRFDGMNWVEEQELTAPDASGNDRFGVVSISGDTVVVGAFFADCELGLDCGAAYVYRYDGKNWIEEQELTASDAASQDVFGFPVSISGDVIVIGALSADGEAGADTGAAYVYRFDGTNWIEQEKLTASDATSSDRFGTVRIKGDTIVVGAYLADCRPSFACGAAYVYRFDGTSWIEQQRLTASNAATHDRFGLSVSLSGESVVVGAMLSDCAAGGDCGAAYIFDLTGGDCNCNGVADRCDSNCDGFGTPDDCAGLPDSDDDGVPDVCDICPDGDDTLDTDGDGVPDDCDICDNNLPETCIPAPPILAPPPHDILKNRYISIDPRGEAGINVGLPPYVIRVELVSTLVNGVDPGQIGSQWWANAPDARCISIVGPDQPAIAPSWTGCDVIHLTGCAIIPTSTYEIAAVVDGLQSGPPLAATTQARPIDNKWWGDAIGLYTGPEGNPPFVWTGPQGAMNFDDVVACLWTFQDPNGLLASHTSVMDIHPNRPDLGGLSVHPNKSVGIGDVFQFIQAFQGGEYPGGDLAGCSNP